MNRRFVIWAAAIAACAGLVTIAGKTRAGLKTSQAVVIVTTPTTRLANADLGFAHNTANNVEQISCTVSTNTSSASVSCFARNSEGLTVSCLSTDPDLVAAARSLSSDSYLIFRWNDEGQCTNITVRQGSASRPKAP